MPKLFEGDKEKLAKMSFKGKIDYIWEYYKIGIIGTILAIFLIVSFVRIQLANNPDAITIFTCDIYASEEAAPQQYLNDAFKEYLGQAENTKDPIEFDSTLSLEDSNSSTSYITIQKLMAVVSSNKMELMIATKDGMLPYAEMSMFADLEKELPAELFQRLKQEDVIFEVTEVLSEEELADGDIPKTYYCGISLEGNQVLREAGYHTDNIVIGLINSSKKKDTAIEFLEMLLK